MAYCSASKSCPKNPTDSGCFGTCANASKILAISPALSFRGADWVFFRCSARCRRTRPTAVPARPNQESHLAFETISPRQVTNTPNQASFSPWSVSLSVDDQKLIISANGERESDPTIYWPVPPRDLGERVCRRRRGRGGRA